MPPSARSPGTPKVNIAAINYHFRDKEGLYGAVLEEVFHLGFTRFPGNVDLAANADPQQRLQAFIRAMFYRLQSKEGWGGIGGRGRLIARELLDPSPAFEAVLDRYIKPHKDLLVAIIIDIMGNGSRPGKVHALRHLHHRPVYLLCLGLAGHPQNQCRQRPHRRKPRPAGRIRLALFPGRHRQNSRRNPFLTKGSRMKKRLRIIIPLAIVVIAGIISYNLSDRTGTTPPL